MPYFKEGLRSRSCCEKQCVKYKNDFRGLPDSGPWPGVTFFDENAALAGAAVAALLVYLLGARQPSVRAFALGGQGCVPSKLHAG